MASPRTSLLPHFALLLALNRKLQTVPLCVWDLAYGLSPSRAMCCFCCLPARLKAKGSGEMYAEPKLEPKKHRRESRKRAKQAMADELGALDEELEELSLDFK